MARAHLNIFQASGSITLTHEFAARLAETFVDSIGQVSREFSVVVGTGSNFASHQHSIAWAKGIPVINIESSVRFSKALKPHAHYNPFPR